MALNAATKVKEAAFYHKSKGAIRMKKEQEKTFGLSYESDGEMGEKDKSNTKDNKEQNDMFFNITQDSE